MYSGLKHKNLKIISTLYVCQGKRSAWLTYADFYCILRKSLEESKCINA